MMQVDTPSDIAARTRFGKFRGLRSWRTSAWDPKENLPREYARVFAFQNPTRALKRCCPAVPLSAWTLLHNNEDVKFLHIPLVVLRPYCWLLESLEP